MSLRNLLEIKDDIPDTHFCRRCNQHVSLDLWDIYDIISPHKRFHCKPCKTIQSRALRLLKEQHKFDNPTHCTICDCEPAKDNPKGKMQNKLFLDHCHKTLKFRGWVCDACNNVLSRAKDNPTILRSAAKYLEDFENGEGKDKGEDNGETGGEY